MLTEHISGDFFRLSGRGRRPGRLPTSVGNSLLDVRGMERLKSFREWLDVLAV